MANEYTLADFERLAKSSLTQGVIRAWREESLIMDKLPWKKVSTLDVEIVRTKTLPTTTWMDIGDSLTQAKGDFEPVKERIHKFGAKIDLPKEYDMADSIVNQRAIQTEMISRSLALGFNDKFINGDPTSSSKEIIGLWYRLKNLLEAGQSIDAGAGSGLDISPDASGLAANMNTFLYKLDSLIHAVEGHKADALLMNSTCFLRIQAILREQNLLAPSKDMFGRTIVTWGAGGPQLVDMGYKADQSTAIIGNVELATGAALTGGASTSIYAVRWGEPHMAGFYLYDITVDDVGLLEDRVNKRTTIDWTPGIYHVNPRSIARMYGIIAA